MDPSDETPPLPPAAEPRSPLRRLPVVFGVLVIGLLMVFGGKEWNREQQAKLDAETRSVRAEAAKRLLAVDAYRGRMSALLGRVEQARQYAAAQIDEPLRSWARERARLLEALMAKVQRESAAKTCAALAAEIEKQCADGDPDAARAALAKMPAVTFPAPEAWAALQQEMLAKPLVALSRMRPATYKALAEQEPALAAPDLAELRKDLAASADAESLTPQQMMRLELLSAVAPADDPALAEWNAVASAGDFLENADATALAHWRKAQAARRAQDWPAALAHMQAIGKTTARTRQPFRAAYGWALLNARPEAHAEAYPFLVEAAAAGDREARAWVAKEDLAQGRPEKALRWLEDAALDGEADAVPQVIRLYAQDVAPTQVAREVDVLQRLLTRPDVPPLGWVILGRLHELGRGMAASRERALACYQKAAGKNSPEGQGALARCYLRGLGTPENSLEALAWATRAYSAGEREQSVPVLLELMQLAPDRVAGEVQKLLEREFSPGGGGYGEKRTEEPSGAKLRAVMAQHFDSKGQFGLAARYYAAVRDAAMSQRLAELNASHACDTCGGAGKVTTTAPCPLCGGRGEIPCSHCDGHGTVLTPGAPPCETCGGRGTLTQGGKLVTCVACSGTGKGHDSVTKKPCTFCTQGLMHCPQCVQGRITITKECPECHGVGRWTLAGRGAE